MHSVSTSQLSVANKTKRVQFNLENKTNKWTNEFCICRGQPIGQLQRNNAPETANFLLHKNKGEVIFSNFS